MAQTTTNPGTNPTPSIPCSPHQLLGELTGLAVGDTEKKFVTYCFNNMYLKLRNDEPWRTNRDRWPPVREAVVAVMRRAASMLIQGSTVAVQQAITAESSKQVVGANRFLANAAFGNKVIYYMGVERLVRDFVSGCLGVN